MVGIKLLVGSCAFVYGIEDKPYFKVHEIHIKVYANSSPDKNITKKLVGFNYKGKNNISFKHIFFEN